MAAESLKDILPEFQAFLTSRKLVPEKNVRFYALWAQRFLAFVNMNDQGDLDALASGFLDHQANTGKAEDWQIRQAELAVKLYLDQFGARSLLREVNVGRDSRSPLDLIINGVGQKHP